MRYELLKAQGYLQTCKRAMGHNGHSCRGKLNVIFMYVEIDVNGMFKSHMSMVWVDGEDITL